MIGCDKNDQPGRMSGDERREHILRAAVSLFSVRGFSGTTTKEIARRSGVSEAMVFRHFANKEQLFEAILNAKMCSHQMESIFHESGVLTALMDADDDMGVFREFGTQLMARNQSDTEFIRLLMYSALEEHPMAERFFREFVVRIYDFLGAYIERRQSEGAIKPGDPRIFIRAFVGMLMHHSLNYVLWDRNRRILNISNEFAAEVFAELLINGIGGVRPGEAGPGQQPA